MYRFIRKATIVNAAVVPAATSFGMEVSGYLTKTYGIQVKTGMMMFGHLNMHWHFDIDSLDKLGELNTKLIQDKNYTAMLAKAKDFWVDGSLKDQVVMFP